MENPLKACKFPVAMDPRLDHKELAPLDPTRLRSTLAFNEQTRENIRHQLQKLTSLSAVQDTPLLSVSLGLLAQALVPAPWPVVRACLIVFCDGGVV